MLIDLLDKMKASAQVVSYGVSSLTPEEVQKLLSLESLPDKDVKQGSHRYCHGLKAKTDAVAEYLGGRSSGNKMYPPGGYLQWHTNSNDPGIRVYCVFATGEGSWFRYIKDGNAITLTDQPGWNIRAFSITKKNPLWHCVYAATDRYSFGFNCKSLRDDLQSYFI